jgi:hypothetical protein
MVVRVQPPPHSVFSGVVVCCLLFDRSLYFCICDPCLLPYLVDRLSHHLQFPITDYLFLYCNISSSLPSLPFHSPVSPARVHLALALVFFVCGTLHCWLLVVGCWSTLLTDWIGLYHLHHTPQPVRLHAVPLGNSCLSPCIVCPCGSPIFSKS